MPDARIFSCPDCGRKNMTRFVQRTHDCHPIPTLKPMPKTPSKALVKAGKPIDLDKLDANQISTGWKFEPDELGRRAQAMIAHVEGLKLERSKKGILAGLYLGQVKAVLGHGAFGKWQAKHFPKGHSTAAKYMALAAVFCRKSKVLLPELVGANQLSLDLSSDQDEGGRAILAKLDKFVGTSGLTELMQKHDVIKAPPPASPVANTAAGTALTHEAAQTEEEKHLAAIADLRRSAIDTLTSLNELGDRWQLLTDAQLKVTLADMKVLSRQMNAWLDTPVARRAVFDPAPYVSGEAEKAVLARRAEGVAFAAIEVASPSA